MNTPAGVLRLNLADFELLDTTRAARYLKIKVAVFRSGLKGANLEGMRIKAGDRAVVFAGMKHPNPDCFMPGPFWRKAPIEPSPS